MKDFFHESAHMFFLYSKPWTVIDSDFTVNLVPEAKTYNVSWISFKTTENLMIGIF